MVGLIQDRYEDVSQASVLRTQYIVDNGCIRKCFKKQMGEPKRYARTIGFRTQPASSQVHIRFPQNVVYTGCIDFR